MSLKSSKIYFLRKKRENLTEDFKILNNLIFSNISSSHKINKKKKRKNLKKKDNKKFLSEKKSKKRNFVKQSISNYSTNKYDNSNDDFSEEEEEKIYCKDKYPLFKEFINDKKEIVTFKCFPDYYFNCDKISEKTKKKIFSDFDNDNESDNEQIKLGKQNVFNLLNSTFKLMKKNDNYLKTNLYQKLIFVKK